MLILQRLVLSALAASACAAIVCGLRATPIISEFMASNDSTIADQDGDYADWLEIYNPDATADNLGGWYLTDKASKPTLWAFPAVTLQPGAYLVVFASGKNYTNPAQPLATNFNISDSGGYVALVESDGKTVASSYTYPAQYPDVSYGISQPTVSTQAAQVGFFAVATPGAANGGQSNLLLPDLVTISTAPGLFVGSLTTSLSGAASGDHLRYSLTAPQAQGVAAASTTAASTEYTSAISVTSTNLLQAKAFSADDSQHGLPANALYVQLDNSTANRVDTFSTPMPIFVFDDHGAGALPEDNAYHPAWVGAYSPGIGGTATLTQTPDFFTPATVMLHGSSSATYFLKKSYDIDLADNFGDDLKEPFFGLDSSKSWVTVGPYEYDLAFIRNAFVYALSSRMGHWAARTRFAEQFVHTQGGVLDYTSYAGITVLTDRIKVATDRVNIASISTSDVTAPNVTGGYILRIDHPQAGDYSWTTQQGVTVMVDTPNLASIVQPQVSYITGYVQQMENALYSDQASGWSTHAYLDYLDRASWVDYHLINVFVENVDAFQFSEYFSKDINGPIVAGPVWDYDRSMGSADGRDANPQQWTTYGNPDVWTYSWWGVLATDPDFMQAWIDRWQSLRGGLYANGSLVALANSLAAQIDPAAAARDEAAWPADASRYGNWAGEVSAMTAWLTARAEWIDQQFVAIPTAQVSSGSVTLTAPAGAQVAYTLDGSDPRAAGGSLAPGAILAGSPVTLTLGSGQTFNARSYNASMAGTMPGSPWSSPTAAASRLINVSARAAVSSGSGSLIDGFVIAGPAGSTETVLLRGVGPGLSAYGLSGLLAQPTISLFDSGGNLIATNTGWTTASYPTEITQAAAASGAFALQAGSADSALLVSLAPGAYSMVLSSANQGSGLALGESYEVGTSNCHLLNLSARGNVGAQSSVLIAGFVVGGSGPSQVLVRGVGPTLANYGISNPLAQPILQVYDSAGNLLASNTGWGTAANPAAIAAAASQAGAFALPAGSADSAQLLMLPPGAYTVMISGANGEAGIALAESYILP